MNSIILQKRRYAYLFIQDECIKIKCWTNLANIVHKKLSWTFNIWPTNSLGLFPVDVQRLLLSPTSNIQNQIQWQFRMPLKISKSYLFVPDSALKTFRQILWSFLAVTATFLIITSDRNKIRNDFLSLWQQLW